MKKLFSAILIFCLGVNVASAVVADSRPVTRTQSDRKDLTFIMKGDERVTWAKTLDGYTLLRDSNDDYVYAVADGMGGIKLSKMLAHNAEVRSAEEKEFVKNLDTTLFYSKEQISMMKQYFGFKQDFVKKLTISDAFPDADKEDYKMVVILMSFSDLAFTTPKKDIEDLFNQVGYSKNGHPGSVHDYFVASSYGKLNLSATVAGPYTASKSVQYYGESQVVTLPNGQEYTINDLHVRELITEAVQAANKDIDFSEFTNSSESNQVSCVYVLYAGYAQSQWGNPSYTIWPHRSVLEDKLPVDGVYVYDYGCSSEFDGNQYYTQPLKIGTICHEFSHVLGQPDYYDTDYESNGSGFQPAEWDIMASGSYNNGGSFPPVWSTMERMVRGYVNVEQLPISSDVTLPDLQYENRSYMAYYPMSTTEYLIFENRQRTGWDSYMPGHGMLVFHVDENVTGWNSNCINCVANDVGYAVIPANNAFNNNSMAGQPFPGLSNVTKLTSASSPNSNSKAGGSFVTDITNIKENTSTGNITFVTGNTAGHVNINDFTIKFNADTLNAYAVINNSSEYSVEEKGFVYSKDKHTPLKDSCLSVTDNSNNADITYDFSSLDKGETYYIRPYVKVSGYANYSYGETQKVKIPCQSVTDFPYVVSFEDGEAECWMQEYDKYIANNWKYVDSSFAAQDKQGAYEGDKYAYVHNDHTNVQDVKLVTEPINTTVLDTPVLRFYHHRKSLYNNTDKLNVYYKTSLTDKWQLLKSYTDEVSDWKLDTIHLTEKSKTLFIAFEALTQGGCGVALDNVEITDVNMDSWPAVSTDSVYNVTNTSAMFKATVSSAGYTPVTSEGFLVSTDANAQIGDGNIIVVQSSETNLGEVICTAEGLESATDYYVKAYVKNGGLTSYGQALPFSTRCARIEDFPYVADLSSGDTTCFDVVEDKLVLPVMNFAEKDSMEIRYMLTSVVDGIANDVNLYYKNGILGEWEPIGTAPFEKDKERVVSLATAGHQNENSYIAFENVRLSDYDVILSALTVKAVSQTAYISTDTAYLSQYNQVTAMGTVSYEGMTALTDRGICYSESPNPTINDTKVTSTGGEGSFTVTINNLQPLTTYYLRAYATNSYGTAYGREIVLTTPFIPIFNNTISQDQYLCEGSIPQQLIGSLPTGGDGEFTYLWISSLDSIHWEECNEGAVTFNQSYEPRQQFNTNHYRRVVSSGSSVDTSNTVTIHVDMHSKGGSVFPTVDTALQYKDVRVELRAYVGDILYWEYRRSGYEWQSLENSADSVFYTDNPKNIGYYSYRAAVKNGQCGMVYSNSDSVLILENIGLELLNAQNEIAIVPNPSSGRVVVVSKRMTDIPNALITVTDLNSKAVFQQKRTLISGNNEFNFDNLESGTYIITVEGQDLLFKNRLIISK